MTNDLRNEKQVCDGFRFGLAFSNCCPTMLHTLRRRVVALTSVIALRVHLFRFTLLYGTREPTN